MKWTIALIAVALLLREQHDPDAELCHDSVDAAPIVTADPGFYFISPEDSGRLLAQDLIYGGRRGYLTKTITALGDTTMTLIARTLRNAVLELDRLGEEMALHRVRLAALAPVMEQPRAQMLRRWADEHLGEELISLDAVTLAELEDAGLEEEDA